MKRNATSLSILLVVLSSLFVVTCSKEYSYEGGALPSSQSATYTIIASGNNCTGATVNGTYQAGKALESNNTVQLQVHVSQTGSYIQTTNTINGFSFASTGIFTDTGKQTITLIGTGKPLVEGDNTFYTTGSVCGFTIRVNKAASNLSGFTLTGSPDVCISPDIKGSYVSARPLSSTEYVYLKVNVRTPGPYVIKCDTINGMSFEASGTFATTGAQIVLLKGIGTPEHPGIFSFVPMSDTTGCSFNIEVINPHPLATYVLESAFGNPNPCISTVNGNYTAQTALNNSNTIKITVFVTVAGNFSIQSNSVNGMQFSYTGTFTSTGQQTVLLKGSGKPLSVGSFSFIPQIVGPHPLGGATCAVMVQVK